jgi:hypothetical protein
LYSVDFELVRVIMALAMFGIAARLDIRKGEVDDRLWIAFAVPAAALYFFDYANFNILMALFSAGIGGAASYALYRAGLFGGADPLAIMTFLLILPTYSGQLIVAGSPLTSHQVTSLTLLSNAALLSLAHVVINLIRNAMYWAQHNHALFEGLEDETGSRKALAVILGHRFEGKGLAFLMEKMESGKRVFDFSLKPMEDTPFETKRDVWVMPPMRFLVYMFAGLVVTIFFGDIALALFAGRIGQS